MRPVSRHITGRATAVQMITGDSAQASRRSETFTARLRKYRAKPTPLWNSTRSGLVWLVRPRWVCCRVFGTAQRYPPSWARYG